MFSDYSPIVVTPDNKSSTLQRVNLMDNHQYDEKWLQAMIFDNASLLPFYDIEPDYVGTIPVCMEFPTRSGRIDCLYVTPTGRLVITEVKLYRNPESRREVVGQTLDYAKDLTSMDYTMLDNAVRKRSQGRGLFQMISEATTGLSQASFIDAVQRNLRQGRFLLLVVGDGIREGAEDIKSFLNRHASMEFAFAMIEMRVYHINHDQLLVQPQLLHKTDIIERRVITLDNHAQGASINLIESVPPQDEQASTQPNESAMFNQRFWQGFLENVSLDDKSQPLPLATSQSHLFFQLPPSTSVAWMTVYKLSNREIGCFARFAKSSKGRELYQILRSARHSFEDELVNMAVWNDEQGKVVLPNTKVDLTRQENWSQAYDYYQRHLNSLISEFRPLLLRILREGKET